MLCTYLILKSVKTSSKTSKNRGLNHLAQSGESLPTNLAIRVQLSRWESFVLVANKHANQIFRISLINKATGQNADLILYLVEQKGHISQINRYSVLKMVRKFILCNSTTTSSRNLSTPYQHRALQCQVVTANEMITVIGQEMRDFLCEAPII